MFRPRLIYCSCLLAGFVVTRAASAGCAADRELTTSRYEIRDGIALDLKTGLTWNRCSVGQRWTRDNGCVGVVIQMNWIAAMALNSGDWRLPTREELSTLVVAGCMNPAIDEEAFPDMELPKLWYWTSTAEGLAAWYIAFGGGTQRTASQTQENAVRLVRRDRA